MGENIYFPGITVLKKAVRFFLTRYFVNSTASKSRGEKPVRNTGGISERI
jgi:hypothetical protein